MRLTGLNFDQIPPLDFPVRFYLVAPLFAILAGLLLIAFGEQLWLSRWTPLTLAITHLMALGVIAMIMFGSLFQLLPVLCGVPIALNAGLVSLFLAVFSLGIISLASAFLSWTNYFPALIFLFASLISFAGFLAYTLWFKASGKFTRLPIFLAIVAFTITILLGFSFLLNLHTGMLGALGKTWTNIHAAFGTFGWVILLIVTVSFQVIPMFHVTPEFPSHMRRFLPAGLFLLLIALAIELTMVHSSNSFTVILLLLTLYAGYALHHLKQRKRKLPDTTIKFWQQGISALLIAILIMLLNTFSTIFANVSFSLDVLIGVLLVLGVILSVIQGMLLKIVPFLITLHLQQHAMKFPMGMGLMPDHYALISRKQGLWLFKLHLSTCLVALASTFYPPLIKAVGLLLIINWSYLWILIYRSFNAFNKIKQAISNT